MTDLTTLQDLITRLEKAEGPDRELDADIALAVGEVSRSQCGRTLTIKGHDWVLNRYEGTEWWDKKPSAYTGSVDAALSLMREVLLGTDDISIVSKPPGGWVVTLAEWRMTPKPHRIWRSEAASESLPIAILMAVLRAKAAMAETEAADA